MLQSLMFTEKGVWCGLGYLAVMIAAATVVCAAWGPADIYAVTLGKNPRKNRRKNDEGAAAKYWKITENTAGERQMIRKEDNGKTSE